MANRDTDTRACSLVDIPLIRRISDDVAVLDTEIEYTRELYGPSGAILSGLLLPQRHAFTLIARVGDEQAVGHFRMREPEGVAHIVYVAPTIRPQDDDTAWLHVLDAMAREAGRHDAQVLVGEVSEDDPLFETMRHSGFAVYARQQIWRRPPGDYVCLEPKVILAAAQETDLGAIQGLVARVVPKMLHPFSVPTGLQAGWVYYRGGRLLAYIAVGKGRHGVYLTPFIDPGAMPQAPAIFHDLIQNIQGTGKLPLYVQVRRYQEWLHTPLHGLGFVPGPSQALMVRHIKAIVRQPKFALAKKSFRVVPNLVTMGEMPDDYDRDLTLMSS